MKKIVCLLLLLTVFQLDAQTFRYAARAGLNLADKTNTSGTLKPGLNFGVSAEYLFTPLFSAEAGLYYSMQGSKFKFANTDLEHNYLNIPLLAKYYVYRGLSFFAGPQLGIKANVNKQAFGSKEFETKRVEGDMVKPFDLSAVIGAGYLLENGFFVSANINAGLTNTAKSRFDYDDDNDGKGTSYPTDKESFKNIVIQFNFGYCF
ncbi:MAG: PorT family protein [Tannerellaceae bacterium]|nr:PorT family protein [Tannerellaceae bacterium]